MTDTAPFRIKDFNTLVQEMILTARAHTERITDYNIGSVARTLLETPGLEIDALYQAMYFGLLDAIPIAIYEGFGFSALPALAASGYAVFTLDSARETDTLIPAGTLIRQPGHAMTWQTQADATIPAGETTATVLIAATVTGAAGNRNAGELLGYKVTALANGLVMERAQRVRVEETPGHVNLYVWNGHGQTGTALCSEISRLVEGYWDEARQQTVPGYRPAGMRVDVHPMTDTPVDITLELDAAPADQTPARLSAAVAALQATVLAEPVNGLLRPVELLNSVLPLSDILGARLHTPTESVPVAPYAALVPGVITALWNPEG